MPRFLFIMILAGALLTGTGNPAAEVHIKKIDFLNLAGVKVNAAGPLLILMDNERNHLMVANTLSSSLSIIAPVGQTSAQAPQNLHPESARGRSEPVPMYVSLPFFL